MAQTGSFTTNKLNIAEYKGSDPHYTWATFSWKVSSQNFEENYSIVEWNLKIYKEDHYRDYAATINLEVNGEKTDFRYYCKELENEIETGSSKVLHDNDGKANFSFKFDISPAIEIYETKFPILYGNDTVELDQIPTNARITGATNFSDSTNPYMTFSNIGNYTLDTWLTINPISNTEIDEKDEKLCVKNGISNTNSYLWDLTREERKELKLKSRGKSSKVRYVLATHRGEKVYTTFVDKIMDYKESKEIEISETISIEVMNKFGETLAVFTNKDEDVDGNSYDKIINPTITLNQNSDNIFSFSISEKSKKWEQIKNIENLYKVDGRIYSPMFEDSYTHVITEDNQNLIQVKAYERQKLLSKKYPTVWNSVTGFENIDNFMVVILSKGNLPLKNNDQLVDTGGYNVGSAGYIMKGLLHGTGWSVGIVDVDGTYDFETEQVSIYDNLLKVQELYGGILIFDSNNKIVSLRDETKYISYKGYEIRKKKNLTNLNLTIDNTIITKLYVFGENNLNIGAVNDKKIYLENYTYSNEVYEGILTNTDIFEADQLLAWGKRNLLSLCCPRKTLTANITYLSQNKDFKNEELKLNDSVKVYMENEEPEMLRVTGVEYSVFSPSSATITLENITKNTNDVFKKISNTTNAYTTGKIDSTLLINYDTGRTVAQEFEVQRQQNINFSTSYNGLAVDILNVANKVDSEGNRISTVESNINNIELTTKGLTQSLQSQGGTNLLRNSSGSFGTEFWRGSPTAYTSTEIKQNFFAKSCFYIQKGTIGQNISVPNGKYYVGFKYKKNISLANCKVIINDTEVELSSQEYTTSDNYIDVTDYTIKFEVYSDTDNSCYIGDIIIVAGEKQQWSPNSNEIYTNTVTIGEGIQVNSNSANTYSRMDADGNRVFNKATNEVVTENTDKGVVTTNIVADQGQISKILINEIDDQTWLTRI